MYNEKQYLHQNKIIWVVGIILLIPVAVMIYNFKGVNINFIIQTLFLIIIALLMMTSNLQVQIDPVGVHYKMFPFINQQRTIEWSDIKDIHVRQYEPIGEYGGWGLRGIGKNRAFNTHGNIGIQIETINGDKILIGTQQKTAVERALAQYRKKNR